MRQLMQDLHNISRTSNRRGAWTRHGSVVLLYLAVTLLFTYPTLFQATHAIGGTLKDALENYWNLWWTYEAIIRLHQNPFHATWMHYPFELPLYFHTYDVFNGLLSLPLQACCGTAVAYNVLNIAAFVLAAVGAYALVLYLTGRRAAAVIAGLIYGFSPYMAFHYYAGQPFMMMIGWLAFYVLTLLKGLRERPRWLVAAALFLTVIGLTDWHLVVFALTATAVIALYETVRARSVRSLAALAGKLLVVGAVFAMLISPVVLPMIAEIRAEPYAERPLWHSIAHSTDLAAFVLPSPFHPLWGAWASRIFFGRLVVPEVVGGIGTLGFTALLLAVYALWRSWRRSLVFAGIFAIAFLLALGPYLQVGGTNSSATDFPIPLPYLLFRQLPFMDVMRIPSRFVALAMLGLSVLAGLGAAAIMARPWFWRLSARSRSGLIVVIALLIMFEYWPRPLGMTDVGPTAVSPFYQYLGSDPADYALVEVPHLEQRSMFNQTYHHKRTVGGRISRQKVHPWIDARVFGPLIRGEEPTATTGDASPQATRAALGCMNVRYAIFYKQNLTDEQKNGGEALKQALFGDTRPIYEDQFLAAYGPFQPDPKKPFWTPEPDDWYPIETLPEGTIRWIKQESSRITVYPCGSTTNVVLHADVFTFARPRTVEILLNGMVVHSQQVQPNQLVNLSIPLALHPGPNTVGIRSAGAGVSPASLGQSSDDRLLRLGVRNLKVEG